MRRIFHYIRHKILFSFNSAMINMAIFTRGRDFVHDYLIMNDLTYEQCICCDENRLWASPGYRICALCYKDVCITNCVECNRNILTNVNNEPTHFEMKYCFACQNNVDIEIKNELQSHKIICKYNHKTGEFTLTCATKNENEKNVN